MRCTCKSPGKGGYHDSSQHSPLLRLEPLNPYIHPREIVQFEIQHPSNNRSSFLLPKLDLDNLDYALFRRWLHHCRDHHGSHCDWTHSSPIPGLRVIDCDTMQVVPAPEDDFRYVALSYVWGNTIASRNAESGFPSTIRDAVIVTTELGYRYLWVDQYVCSLTSLLA